MNKNLIIGLVLLSFLFVPPMSFGQTNETFQSNSTVVNGSATSVSSNETTTSTTSFEPIVNTIIASLPNVIVNEDHNLTINPDGSTTWTGHIPYIQNESGDFVPYILTEIDEHNIVQVDVNGGQFIFDKNGSSVSVIKDGEQLINNDRYTVRTAQLNSDEWSNLDVNNEPSTLTIDESGNYLTISFIKENNEGLFKTEYIVYGGHLKTTAYFTNYIYDNNKFAFTQTLHLPDSIISVNDQEIDLNNYVGQSFPREVLEQNEDLILQIKSLYYNSGLGFDNLWSVNISDANKISLDYANVSQTQTGINETMELDPTFGWATNQQSGYMRSQVPYTGYTGIDCSPSGITANGYINLYTPTSANTSTSNYAINMCYRSGMDYDISSIPDNAIISDVDLSVDVTSIGGGGRAVEFVQMSDSMEYYRLGTGNGGVTDYLGAYNDAGGNAYVSNTGIGTVVSNNNLIDLGSVADADLQSDLTNGAGRGGADVFTVGVKLQNEDRNGHIGTNFNSWSIFDAIQLQVTYSSSPDAPTPTATQNTTTNYNTVDLTWNTPSANGAPITSYDVYRGGSNIGTLNGSTSTIILDDDFSSSSGWTHIGGQNKTSITGGELFVNNSQGHILDQMTKSLGHTLDNTWEAEVDWKRTAYSGSGGGEATPLAVLSGNGGLWDWYGGSGGSTDDAIAVLHWTTGYGLAVRTGDGNNYATGTGINMSSLGTWQYLTLERVDQDNVKLSVYTDSARTTHATNSPFTWNISSYGSAITGLDHVSTGNYLANGSTSYRYVTAYGDNIKVTDSSNPIVIPPATTFTDTSAPDSSNISYTLDATNSIGTSSQGTAGLVETFYKPNAPTNLSDGGANVPLILNWTGSTVNSVTNSVVGSAWNFDASSGNGYGATTNAVNTSIDQTYSMWLKFPLLSNNYQWASPILLTGTSQPASCWYPIMIDKGSGGSSSNHWLGAYKCSGTGFVSSGFDLNTLSSGWHHLTTVVDGGTLVTHYIDGTQVSTQGAIAGYYPQGGATVIGDTWSGGNENIGHMDDLGIWNITLSQSDITSLAQGTSPNSIQTNNLLQYYDFENNTSLPNLATGSASLGSSADGTLVNASTGQTGISLVPVTNPSPSLNAYKIERDDGAGYNTIATLTGTPSSNTYPIVVGTGGTGGGDSNASYDGADGIDGGDSSFNGIIANGGGAGGGHYNIPNAGYTGSGGVGHTNGNASGGGAGVNNSAGGTGGSFGNDGGAGTNGNSYRGGSGGGSGGVGGSSGASSGGGIGTQSSISGTATWYTAGGGGGGGSSSANGGSSIGGNGNSNGVGGNGATNTGSGGGGGSGGVGNGGGSGADGIVIIRYLNTSGITATGGTITTSGNYNIHTFTSNGNFVVTNGSGNVEYLIVGAGGGGGSDDSGWIGNARGSGGGGAGAFIESVGTVSTSLSPPPVTYTDNTASGAVTYKISGINAVGTGTGATHNAVGGTVPDAPSNLTTTQTVPFIHDLSWTVPNYNGGVPITNYNVYRDGSLLTTLGNVTSYQDNTMQHIAHTHMYEVSAVNSIGEGPKSNQSTITSWDVPAVVTGVVATAQVGSQIELDWNIPNNGGTAITGYRIQSSIDNITFTDVIASTTTKPYIHTGLTNGVVYYYKISAINVVGEGAVGSAQTIVGDIPDTPSSMTVVPQAGAQITITIAIPNDNGYSISAYGLQRSSDNFTTFTNLTGQTSNVFVDQNLTIGTDYQYKATATNSLGTSPFSTASTATTAGDVPSTPTAPGAVVNTT